MDDTSKKPPQDVAFSSLPPESSEEESETGRNHKGFGLKAPVIDIFDHGRKFLTCFKPIEDLFEKGADLLMEEASKHVIEAVLKPKKEDTNSGERGKAANNKKKSSMILGPEYWVDQQRGCEKHCASHQIYARHMTPLFSDINTAPEEAPDGGNAKGKGEKGVASEGGNAKEESQNVVLFMPYLHWTASENSLQKRTKLIIELSKKNRRPTPEEIEEIEKIVACIFEGHWTNCYSAIPEATQRTVDQVAVKFARKQQRIKEDREAKRSEKDQEMGGETVKNLGQSESREQRSWTPPRIMMVNQLWMWKINGYTVITSSSAKLNKSDQVATESQAPTSPTNDSEKYEWDSVYDPTDIWKTVHEKMNSGTPYGERTETSAYDLAWTIADQAASIFRKRDLDPRLQFMQMFEMEINEIASEQANAFTAFYSDVQAAHNANNIGKILATLKKPQKGLFSANSADDWKKAFRHLASDFIKRLEPKELKDRLDKFEDSVESFSQATQASTEPDVQHSYGNLECELKQILLELFERLKEDVKNRRTTGSMNEKLDSFIQPSLDALDCYTDMIMDKLFDITNETKLVKDIKDILEELNIIRYIGQQQQAVIKPFTERMLPQHSKTKDFHDNTRLRNQVTDLYNAADATYKALRDLLDLKQKHASVIEARSARKGMQAASDDAEATTSLTYQAVRQGWSIMLFTIVTIIFLPLSFFSSLFGMNAKEFVSGDYSLVLYSEIMYPASLFIICLSLGLAFNINFRFLFLLAWRKIFEWTGFSAFWRKSLGLSIASNIRESIEKEKRKRAANNRFRKWELGV
ncbi:hypothetical protein F5882DRAFT_482176 [Hyaloscypha sp. PMI_1271]|nr:hypothetical protein F5882DRAFT_482176 [Hyaloscypha sp. PMI_1271]